MYVYVMAHNTIQMSIFNCNTKQSRSINYFFRYYCQLETSVLPLTLKLGDCTRLAWLASVFGLNAAGSSP